MGVGDVEVLLEEARMVGDAEVRLEDVDVLPVDVELLLEGVGSTQVFQEGGFNPGVSGGCGSSYGTMVRSLMPAPSPCSGGRRQVGGWGGRVGRFGGWGSLKPTFTKPRPPVSSGISSASSGGGCGSCGK